MKTLIKKTFHRTVRAFAAVYIARTIKYQTLFYFNLIDSLLLFIMLFCLFLIVNLLIHWFSSLKNKH